MNYKEFRNYCLSKKGAEETFPFGPESVWFKVMGKMFALTMLEPFKYNGEMAEGFIFVNLKCDPEKAIELRASNPGIQPGWHQSKKHWNSIFTDGSVKDSQIKDLIDHSYDIVVKGMSKKLRTELENL